MKPIFSHAEREDKESKMTGKLLPILLEANDSVARLCLQPHHGTKLVEITGSLQGPHCEGRRTLPATFPLQAKKSQVEVLVTEPCYWTPSHPFLYRLKVALRTSEGEVVEFSTPIGLRRWSAEGCNLMLERRRTVLRGAWVEAMDIGLLPEARQAEIVLLARNLSAEVCKEASRLGIGLIADLRGMGEEVGEQLDRLRWFPAVLIALLEDEQLQAAGTEPQGLLLAQCARQKEVASAADLSIIELDTSECPPDWMLTSEKPIIALRRAAAACTPLASVRHACDRLQAKLASHCDLAGYIV